MIETGFEIVDAVVNNPIQAILLFAIAYIGFKFFCGCHGFWAEMRHDIKFELKWSIQRPIDRQLDHLLEWLERSDKNYNNWRERTSEKKMLGIKVVIISIVLLPILVWNVIAGDAQLLLEIILFLEYLFFISVFIKDYKKNRKKLEIVN